MKVFLVSILLFTAASQDNLNMISIEYCLQLIVGLLCLVQAQACPAEILHNG